MSQAVPLKLKTPLFTEGESLQGAVSNRSEWLEADLLGDLNQLKLARLSSGERILDLSMVNPDLHPPRYLLDRLLEASVKTNNHRYSVSRGIKKLRQAFSTLYEKEFDTALDPESQVCVTMGTKDAIVNTLMVTVEPGDTVLMGEPAYPAHVSACQAAGAKISYFEISSDTSQMLKEIELRLDESTVRLVILNFPNNPTGITVDGPFYDELIRMAQSRGVILLNDFVYGEMGFDGKPQQSLLKSTLNGVACVESYSLSKAYNVPGWRVGALCGDIEIVTRLAKLKSHIDYGVFLPLQIAASAGLTATQDLVGGTTQEYARRARVVSEGLRQLGWNVAKPRAGASVWAEIPKNHFEMCSGASRSLAVSKLFLEAENFLVSPGKIYGERWDNWLRFALVLPSEQLFEVVRKIENCSRRGHES